MMNFFNPDYIVLMDYWDMLLKLSREIKKSSEPTKEMIDNMSKLNEHIKQKTELIFSGKESLKLEQELYEQLLQNRMSLKPEDIVSRKKNNEKVVNIDLYE
jgi:uncharacterized protein Yka (UPF0111/DUF47 family)